MLLSDWVGPLPYLRQSMLDKHLKFVRHDRKYVQPLEQGDPAFPLYRVPETHEEGALLPQCRDDGRIDGGP